MQKYRLEIDNIFVEKGKLNIEAIAEFEINPLATVPKIRLLFCGQGQTRRFPLPVQECTKENGICKAKAQYSYNLYYLFYEQTLTEPDVLTFDLAYGADEYEAVDFTVKSHDNEHLKLDGNRVIIDNKIKYHKQHFGLQDLTKRSTKLGRPRAADRSTGRRSHRPLVPLAPGSGKKQVELGGYGAGRW